MRKPPLNVIELPLIERAEMALKEAVEKVMEENTRNGFPIYILRDGKVVDISAEEIGRSKNLP